MDIYYCEKCAGRPYTRKLKSGPDCPQCGGMLRFEDVSEESLQGRKELVYIKSRPSVSDIIRRNDKQENVWATQFNVDDGEMFYEYLGFEKTGMVDFNVRFILGNQPDENAVITKTPFISPKIKFSQSLELSELELMRKSFEKYFLSFGFMQEPRLFHAFVKNGEEVISKTVSEVYSDEILTDKDSFSARYFINYDFQQFGEIDVGAPFSRDRGIFTEVKRVLDSRGEKFMEYMVFRARNGDNMTLSSFADDSAVIFDEPHLSLIRYDRLLKEAKATRM